MRPLHRAIQLAIICSNATALAPTKFKAVLVGDALLAGRVERSTYEPVRDADEHGLEFRRRQRGRAGADDG